MCTAATDRVAILFWIEWFSAPWQEELVPGRCWATARRPLLSRRLLVEGMFEEPNSDQAIVVGGVWAGMSIANTVLGNDGSVVLLDKSSFCGGGSTVATS